MEPKPGLFILIAENGSQAMTDIHEKELADEIDRAYVYAEL